ncbi:hypothetical protein PENSPDRAFT_692929 [Peniophora sp. CONT]|nr:hypothetical protein PENSPDRAFT_692929 [Peniophora sp. CONT]
MGPMSALRWTTDAEGAFWLFAGGHKGVICSYRVRLVTGSIVVEQNAAVPVTLGKEQIVDMVLDMFHKHLAVICPGRLYLLEVDVDARSPLVLRHEFSPDDHRDAESATASGVAFCTDEGGLLILVVAYIDSRTLRAFRVKPWTTLWERSTGFLPSTLSWVPERRFLLVYCHEGLDVKVLELQDKQLVLRNTLSFNRPNTRHYRKVVSSANLGRLALCGSDEGRLVGWDLSSGKQLPGTLNHGRGSIGGDDGYPGLQVITSTTVLTATQYTSMIAGSSHSRKPVVMLWEMDKDKASKRRWLFGHLVINVLCILFSLAVMIRGNDPSAWYSLFCSGRDKVFDAGLEIGRWVSGKVAVG